MRMGRVLGLDYGDRHVGVAVSDPDRRVATPRGIVTYSARVQLFEVIDAILVEDDFDEIVVGLPLAMSGDDTEQTKRTRAFVEQLEEETGLSVHLEDERLTTAGADVSLRDDPEQDGISSDSVAAQAILQGFLDRQ